MALAGEHELSQLPFALAGLSNTRCSPVTPRANLSAELRALPETGSDGRTEPLACAVDLAEGDADKRPSVDDVLSETKTPGARYEHVLSLFSCGNRRRRDPSRARDCSPSLTNSGQSQQALATRPLSSRRAADARGVAPDVPTSHSS